MSGFFPVSPRNKVQKTGLFFKRPVPMFYLLLILCQSTAPTALTTSSVAGKEHQTPVTPQIRERRKAMGTMTRIPRSRERTWAGPTRSTEAK